MCVEQEQIATVVCVCLCVGGHPCFLCVCVCVSYVLSLGFFISLYCKIDLAIVVQPASVLCVCVHACPVAVTLERVYDMVEGGRSPLSDLESRPICQPFSPFSPFILPLLSMFFSLLDDYSSQCP